MSAILLVSGVASGLVGCGSSSTSASATRTVDASAFAGTPAVPPLATPYTLPPDEPRPGSGGEIADAQMNGDTPVITLGGRPARVIATPPDSPAQSADTGQTGSSSASPPMTSPAMTSGVTTSTTPPTLSGATPPAVLEPLTLDATVGQINGEPVYADAFFKDNLLEERLVAESARRKTQREWLTIANDAISKALVTRVRDELVLADAYADFPGEKRQGLLSFLNKIQSDEISQRGGSAVLAEQELLESSGKTLDQEAKSRLEQELIGYKISQRVRSRAVVTPRQVRREYERNYNEFNEPSTAHFRLIFVDADKPEAVEAVRAALASGVPFAQVASGEANTYNRAEGGAIDVKVRGPLGQAEQLFAAQPITDAARTLSPGSIAGPVAWGENNERLAWVHLESIDPGKSISLYDAQLGIETSIRDRRVNEERDRYFAELLDRGSYSDIDIMRDRLLAIALERYWRPTVTTR